uniref:SMP-30/Gluconolactonase/LRE-like region domain-containing protein n=1 Tax=Oryza punctata TaxID=4537 RepID=A0A0E0LAA2_ORYPU
MAVRRSRAPAVLVAALLLTASAATASAASSYPASADRVAVQHGVGGGEAALVAQIDRHKDGSMVKYEGGYAVETVFDGSKLGIEPHDVEVTPSGELLVLDSMNSNVYRVQLPLSRYSRPKLVAGSPEGLSGHVDGRLREAKMNHPKGFTVDDRGNIYVADAMNMAIRKISDTGVTTIAGGKSMRGGHLDGPSDDAKFSTDFEIRYISSSCSLLVIDRGNQAIREIALHNDDCEYQYEASFPLGIALLFAAGFFGYMLALLQRRVLGMVSTADEPQTPPRPSIASIPPYQKPLKPTLRPPLIPTEDQAGKQEAEEGFFTSIGKLIGGAKSSAVEIFSRKKRPTHQYHHHLQQQRANPWPVQESYAIPHDETPPPLDMRAATPRKNYAFMTKEPEKVHHVRHGRPYFNGWDVQHAPQQQPEQQMYHQQHLQQHRQYSAGPQTFYEQSCETTNEIVFGAVQEVDTKRRMVEIKAVNYGDTFYEQYGMRYRNNYIGYNNSSNGGNNNNNNNNSYY